MAIASKPNQKRRRGSVLEYVFGRGEVYKSRFRAFELGCCIAFFGLTAFMARDVAKGLWAVPQTLLFVLPVAFLSYLCADFVSGFVHFLADTYLTEHTPLIGPKLIFPFREHHRDPKAITTHDFVEANCDNCFTTLFVLVPTCFLSPATRGGPFTLLSLFVLLFSVGILMTSIAHGWAHQDTPPLYARFLQGTGLVISKTRHARHHEPPHRTNYCITSGWLNPLLDGTQFFPRLEWLLSKVGIRRQS